MPSSEFDIREYLKPEVVASLSNMEIRARMVVEGFLIGLHKSPYHGFSAEFAEYHQYNPGDPIRNIDWRCYARTDRFYIKEFEEDQLRPARHRRSLHPPHQWLIS